MSSAFGLNLLHSLLSLREHAGFFSLPLFTLGCSFNPSSYFLCDTHPPLSSQHIAVTSCQGSGFYKMGQHGPLYFTSFLFFTSLIWAQQFSPNENKSSCTRCDLQLVCNCSYGGFIFVPMVTERALTLDLSFNNITVVKSSDLADHALLRVLSLRGNKLSEIHLSAFDPLWSLEELDLSDNELAVLSNKWFSKLAVLQKLNLLNNPYSCLGSPPVFQGLLRLRTLAFGGFALTELKNGDLSGVTQLDELTVHANNLKSYESETLADIWPLGRVSLSLREAFVTDIALASAVLRDLSHPETPVTLQDIQFNTNLSFQPIKEMCDRRVRYMTFHNVSVSDNGIVNLLVAMDGAPVTLLSVHGITLMGHGRWEKASWTDHKSIDEFFLQNAVVLDVFQFVSLLELRFLLQYPRKVSVINSKVFVMPCNTSRLLTNLQYLDLSDNLLTDMTVTETLCDGDGSMKDLRVLNISGNALKSLSLMSNLVKRLSKLTLLDISRTGYSSMPQHCTWPVTLRLLNISMAKLSTVTSCLPRSLEVLDVSSNDLKEFTLDLPALRELHLSGNKFLRLPPGRLFPNLETLTIQSNTLNMFGHLDLQSFRRLRNLQAGENKFVCSCEFVAFFQSSIKGGGDVHLTDGEQRYVCDSPLYLQGAPVGGVRLSVFECQRVLFVSLSCGVALFVGVVLCVLLWRLHIVWYLRMMCAWLKAKHSSHRPCRPKDALLPFDAFVSYSERDACWVENFLVPELENPRETDEASGNPKSSRPLNLCLHKRDFLPGQWIVDNIMSAMERSRQTVFVLSENFVQSDWCRYELDFSHFWLFDGKAGREAAILILLEPLSKDDVPKRFYKLRKLMGSTTYLEWPQDEERRGEFWRSLRCALRGDED
ncbi:toll-like receptor 2 [Betta splendens]|uniref:Toll-like receptor 2 n=1 Tax=Betta splendens TaxID=158456 RepID=A0A6P7LXY8_BETSP|nr:toll-like receptor 2 [Betta splendens]